jgi:hypothetical protein
MSLAVIFHGAVLFVKESRVLGENHRYRQVVAVSQNRFLEIDIYSFIFSPK